MTRREELRGKEFDFYCHTLLCRAVEDKAKYTALGYTCEIVPETMLAQKFTVYFLAVKNPNKLTRAERGCYV